MIGSFTFETLPCRVVFGSGTLSAAAAEIQRLGGQRAFVLTTPQQETEGRKLGSSLGSCDQALPLGRYYSIVVKYTCGWFLADAPLSNSYER